MQGNSKSAVLKVVSLPNLPQPGHASLAVLSFFAPFYCCPELRQGKKTAAVTSRVLKGPAEPMAAADGGDPSIKNGLVEAKGNGFKIISIHFNSFFILEFE